jgi:hypothetical protein
MIDLVFVTTSPAASDPDILTTIVIPFVAGALTNLVIGFLRK